MTGGGDTDASGAASGDPIVIGFPADLTTDWAYYDSPMQEGAQFAVDQINENGGVLGRPLELQTVDMRNDVAEAAKVTQQLIDDGAVYLIGTVGDGILAEGQVACAANIPISTGLGTAPTLVGDMGECAYQLVMSDNIQAAVLAEYAIAEGYETAYVLGSNEIPYTKDLPVLGRTNARVRSLRSSAMVRARPVPTPAEGLVRLDLRHHGPGGSCAARTGRMPSPHVISARAAPSGTSASIHGGRGSGAPRRARGT